MKPKIIFFGSDKYSEIVLDKMLNDQRFDLTTIVSLPHAKKIERLARKANIPLVSLNKILINNLVKKSRPDVGILASFGQIIPPQILNLPKHGIINLHPSLLPKYRGPTPVPAAILNGETQTGVSILKMDNQVDHGPIIAQFKLDIYPEDTSESLLVRCFSAGAQVLSTILPTYLEGKIKPRQQDHSKATFTPKLARDNGFIPPLKLASALKGAKGQILDRLIRAMQPWPGAWTSVKIKSSGSVTKEKRLKILKSHLDKGKLVLDRVQLEGKNPVTWQQFQQGYPAAKLV